MDATGCGQQAGGTHPILVFVIQITFSHTDSYAIANVDWTEVSLFLITYISTVNCQPSRDCGVIVRPDMNRELIGAIYWYSVDTSGGVVVTSSVVHGVVEYNWIAWCQCINVECC